jgi:hypothetical protein
MGGVLTPKQQNPMMNYAPNPNPADPFQQSQQMPLQQINPRDLAGNPQALYAYHQMMAAIQSGKGSNPQQLPPDVMARQKAIMQMYFPQQSGGMY